MDAAPCLEDSHVGSPAPLKGGFSYVGNCQYTLRSHGLGCELGSRPPRGAQALIQPEWSGVAAARFVLAQCGDEF